MNLLTSTRFLLGYEPYQKKINLNNFKNNQLLSFLDPEFKRRIVGLVSYTVSQGRDAGIGEAYRTLAQQTSEFKRRYKKLTAKQTPSLTVRTRANRRKEGTYKGPYESAFWELKPGCSPVATPGSSYHEPTTPDGKCLAADLVGDTLFMGQIADKFGLTWFGNGPAGEQWHFQPNDIPEKKNKYVSGIHHPLAVFDFSKYWSFQGPSS